MGYYWDLKVEIGANRKGYDPNQPRVPAGDPRGGQWTAAGGGAIQNVIAGGGNLRTQQDRFWATSRAKQMGMNRKDYDEATRVVAEDLKIHAKVTMGTSLNTALKIGESGEILGRQATGHSEGTLVSGMERRETFDRAMGEDFVYATLGLNDAPYGTVRMILDDSVLKGATATNGDSLDQVIGKTRLDRGDTEEIRNQFTQWAVPGESAYDLLASKLLSQLHPVRIGDLLKSGVDDSARRHLAYQELKIPYVEIQIPTRGLGGIDVGKVNGILYRTNYPGRVFDSDRQQRKSLRELFPGIPIREADKSGLYTLLDFGQKPPLVTE
jgi:hypothetical protein